MIRAAYDEVGMKKTAVFESHTRFKERPEDAEDYG